MASPDAPVFLFDGDCAFCSSCARWLIRWVPTDAQVLAWQTTDLGPLGVSAQQADESVVWVPVRGANAAGPQAIAALLASSSRWWARASGRVLDLPGISHLARPVYRWVARNRHRMPGGTPQCSLPEHERGP